MSEPIRRYLESDELPPDYYELIGRRRFDPSPSELKKAIVATRRYLLGYQNHPDPKVIARARRLQTLLAEADTVLGIDEKRWGYEQDLTEKLRDEYGRGAGDDITTWQPKNLRFWLGIQNVHPLRFDELIQRFLTPETTGPNEVDLSQDDVDPMLPGAGASEAEPIGQPASENWQFDEQKSTPTLPKASDDAVRAIPAPTLKRPEPRTQVTTGTTAPTPPKPTKPSAQRPMTVRPRPLSNALPGGQSKAPHPGGDAIAGVGSKAATHWTAHPSGPKQRSADFRVFWIIGSALGAASILLMIVLVSIGPRPARRTQRDSEFAPPAPVESRPIPPSPNPADGGDVAATPTPDSTSADSSEAKESEPDSQLPPDSTTGDSSEAKEDDPLAEEIQAVMHHASPVYALAWSPNGKQLVTGGDGATIRLWDASTGEQIGEAGPLSESINTLVWKARSLAIGIDDGSIILWEVGEKLPKKPLREPSDRFTTFAWTERRSRLLAGNDKGILMRLAPTNGDEKERFSDCTIAGAVWTMSSAVWQERERVACRHLDGTVVIRDMELNRTHVLLLRESGFFDAFEKGLNSEAFPSQYALTPYDGKQYQDVALSPTEQKIALTNDDIEIWDLTDNDLAIRECIIPPYRARNAYCAIDWRPDGNMLAAGGKSGQLCVWDTTRWRLWYQRDFGGENVHALAWNPKQNGLIAAAWEDGSVRVVRVPELAAGKGVDPDFDYRQILEEANELAEEEDWDAVSRALSLLRSYRLSRSDGEVVGGLSFRIDRHISSEVDGLEETFNSLQDDNPAEGIDFVADGQYIVDLRPEATAADHARKLMREAARASSGAN